MSRSGYSDDYDCDGRGGLWRGAVASSIKGNRGQAALRELAAAMDAMPEKKLIAESLATVSGEFCTLGVLGNSRGLNMESIEPEDWDAVAKSFNIAPALVREIVFENDEGISHYEYAEVEIFGPVLPYYPDYGRHKQQIRVDIPAENLESARWERMREWVRSNTIQEDA